MTGRKGNQNVSVTIYGNVNKAVLFWDDGHEKGTYTVDNNYQDTRFGFTGSAKIKGDWSSGYVMEAETRNALSSRVSQFNDDNANDPLGNFTVRYSYMYLDNKVLGQLRWGLTAPPIYQVTRDRDVSGLQDTMFSDDRMNEAFFLRPEGFRKCRRPVQAEMVRHLAATAPSMPLVVQLAVMALLYWSPDLAGFSVSLGYFADSHLGSRCPL